VLSRFMKIGFESDRKWIRTSRPRCIFVPSPFHDDLGQRTEIPHYRVQRYLQTVAYYRLLCEYICCVRKFFPQFCLEIPLFTWSNASIDISFRLHIDATQAK
jgi:hypothetical protein